jgi:hypothetical protein
MDISWGLRFLDGGRPDGGPVSHLILLTSLIHVNRPGTKITPRRIQNGVSGSFQSSLHALELTVPHKTVAEPH